jgi:hypothetical protein
MEKEMHSLVGIIFHTIFHPKKKRKEEEALNDDLN